MTIHHCPACWIELPLSGEANCDCDGGTVQAAPVAERPSVWVNPHPVTAQAEIDRSNRGQMITHGQPTRTQQAPDVAEVRAWLGTLPELCALLPDAAHAHGAIDGPRPAPGSRPPIKLHILHLLDEREKWNWEWGMHQLDPDRQGVLPYLFGWVRDMEATAYELHPQVPDEPPTDPTVANCCDWLARHLDAAETFRQWPEFADGVRILHRNVSAAVAVVRDRSKPVPCNHCGAANLVRDTENRWICPACGHIIAVQAVTIRQAARIVGRPERTLRAWAQRNLLTKVSDGPRTNLFDLGDIRRVAAEVALRDGAV